MRLTLRRLLAFVCAVFLAQIASDAWPQEMSRMSAVGFIDFRSKPRFKVGDWVKYRFTSPGPKGRAQDYDITLIISGEERFWGDDCFWVETWAGGKTQAGQATAILMSYSIFGDTAWLPRIQLYQRKTAQRGEDQNIIQELVRRALGRATGEPGPGFTILTDTLGTDTTTVPMGHYRCQKVQRKSGIGAVEDRGDSTIRFETWDVRTVWLSNKVPITSMAKDVQEHWVNRKAWRVGQSSAAISNEVSRATAITELIAFGSGGLVPKLTPQYARKGLAAQKPAASSTKGSRAGKKGG